MREKGKEGRGDGRREMKRGEGKGGEKREGQNRCPKPKLAEHNMTQLGSTSN